MALILNVISDPYIWVPLFAVITFFVLRRLFFVIDNTYIPGIEIILISCFLFFIAEKINEKVTECLGNFAYFEMNRIGLDPNSPQEMIVHNEQPKYLPARAARPTMDAVVLIHGSCGGPQEMIKLARHFYVKGVDVYLPLLRYHRRRLSELDNVDFYEMANQLQADLKYVADRHSHAYVLGHSLAGALLTYLSLMDRLEHNVSIILYAPAVASSVSMFAYNIFSYTRLVNKYAIIPPRDIYSIADKNLFHYVGARKIPIMIRNANLMLAEMFKNGAKFHNQFAVLLFEKDEFIPYKQVKNLLAQDKNCVYCKVFKGFHHSPHHRKEDSKDFQNFTYFLDEVVSHLGKSGQ